MRKIAIFPLILLALLLSQCSPETEEREEKEPTEEQGEVIEEGGENPNEGEEGNEESNEPEEGYSRASFNFEGEFVQQKSSSIKTEEADLFAIQFYDIETQNPYAYVIGDDINQISVDFRTGHMYMLKITYIKNGQNILSTTSNGWSEPFTNSSYLPTTLNQTTYSSEVFLNSISSPFIPLKNEPGALYVEAERYHGVIESFEITEENNTLSVPLQSLFFGVTLNVDLPGTTLENISFAIHSLYFAPKRYSVALTEGKGSLDIPFISLGIPSEQDQGPKYLNDLDMAVLQDYQENVHFSIGTSENEIYFFDDFVTVERNQKTIIDLLSNTSNETSTGGFTINFGEEMINEYIDLNAQ